MKFLDRSSPTPLNTHGIAYTGIVLALIGTFTPIALSHMFQHMASDLNGGIHYFGHAVTLIGVYGCYKGRPKDVPEQ